MISCGGSAVALGIFAALVNLPIRERPVERLRRSRLACESSGVGFWKATANAVYLAPAEFVDSDHPAIEAFVAKTVTPACSPAEKARRFYLAAREIRYDPDLDYSDPEIYRASSVLHAGAGYCVGKAALFAALCRAAGIPARVGFADVTNHLSSEKLREKMGTNYFAWHGFTEVLLGDRWVKASPTFNSTPVRALRRRAARFRRRLRCAAAGL